MQQRGEIARSDRVQRLEDQAESAKAPGNPRPSAGFGFRVSGLGFRVQGSGLRFSGSGFRV